MKTKVISITQEQFDLLAEEGNASHLIRKLLDNHYENHSEKKLEEAIEGKKKEMTEEETLATWREDIITGFQIFNKAQLPSEEWVDKQIENRKKQFQIGNENQ